MLLDPTEISVRRTSTGAARFGGAAIGDPSECGVQPADGEQPRRPSYPTQGDWKCMSDSSRP